MRILAVIAIWIVIIGGVGLYMGARPEVMEAVAVAPVEVSGGGVFRLEVTPTFTPVADPFSLERDPGAAGIVVWLNSREVLRIPQGVPAGRTVALEPVAGLVQGMNELYVEASPPAGSGQESHGVRVRLLRSGAEAAEETFWSEGGSRVAGVLRVELEEEKGHGH